MSYLRDIRKTQNEIRSLLADTSLLPPEPLSAEAQAAHDQCYFGRPRTPAELKALGVLRADWEPGGQAAQREIDRAQTTADAAELEARRDAVRAERGA